MKKIKQFMLIFTVIAVLVSCKKETRDQISNAKKEVKDATTIFNNAQSIQEKTEKLRQLTPLANDVLKSWLPNSVNGMERTGFKAGLSGYTNVGAISGTYKTDVDGEKKEFRVQIIDGAGNMGGLVMMGMGLMGKLETEVDDEYKHEQSVKNNGIEARQIYFKTKNNSNLKFVYKDRLGVEVTGINIGADEAWDLVDGLDLEELLKKTK